MSSSGKVGKRVCVFSFLNLSEITDSSCLRSFGLAFESQISEGIPVGRAAVTSNGIRPNLSLRTRSSLYFIHLAQSCIRKAWTYPDCI